MAQWGACRKTPVVAQTCAPWPETTEQGALITSAFDLPDGLSTKADPRLIPDDERHFAAIARSLEHTIAELSDRLDAQRKSPGRGGQAAMERDLEIHGARTIVGDRAQARHGFSESWQERLERIGLDRVTLASLSINYRTPEEVMVEAEPVIRAVLPDANVPLSIRSTGVPVVHGSISQLHSILDAWLAAHAQGIACVIAAGKGEIATPRVRSLTPESSKGLEFDLVVLLDPQRFGDGIEGAVDRYVAMTRATQQLVILTTT
jgi:superfamily I DNA/RNA helicase